MGHALDFKLINICLACLERKREMKEGAWEREQRLCILCILVLQIPKDTLLNLM